MYRQGLLLLVVFLTACVDGSSSADASIIYQDGFTTGQTGTWLFEGDDIAQTAVVNDQLIININQPNTIQFATLAEPLFSDFILEVDTRILSGAADGSMGVLFRMQDGERFYRFDITGSGLYIIERRNGDGSWTRLSEAWSLTPAINKGVTVPNRLKIITLGPRMGFYVNETKLLEISDNTYTTGTIALDAGTFGQGDLQVAFDNVTIRRP